MTAATQRNSANQKDTNQEIEQHENELKGLLSRVLKEPLHSAFGEFGRRLDVLEEAVDKLSNEGLPALMQGNEDICKKEFPKLKRFVEEAVNVRLDGMHEQLNPDGRPLGDTVVSKLTEALGTRLEGVENRLAKHIQTSHLMLEQAQSAWQKSQQDRQHELRELQGYLSAQLASLGKSLRAAQIMTLSIATVGALGVLAIVVHSFL